MISKMEMAVILKAWTLRKVNTNGWLLKNGKVVVMQFDTNYKKFTRKIVVVVTGVVT